MKFLIFVFATFFSFNCLHSQEDAYEIANSNIKQRGGQDLLNSIHSIKMNVKISQKGKDQNAIIYIKNNEAYRIEYTDNPKSKEYTLVNMNGGINSSIQNELEKVSVLNNQELETYKQKMDIFGPLMDPRNHGIDLMFLQSEKCGTTPCKIIAYHGGSSVSPEPVKIYLTEKNEIIKTEEVFDTEQGRVTNVTEYSNYKPAKNSPAIFPYLIKQNGTILTINELIINPDLSKVKMTLNENELEQYSKK